MSMKKQHDFKILRDVTANVEPLRLILSLFYLAAMLTCAFLLTKVTGRYPRGFAFLGMIVFLALFLRSVKKLLSDRLQEAIEALLGKVVDIIFFPAAFLIRKIAKFLGIGRWDNWCRDEHKFLWKERKAGTGRKKRLKNDQKWADQVTNRQRVRFLFIEFMIKQIRNGFILGRQYTPDELAAQLALDEDEKLLFTSYDEARYAPDADISDETVKTLTAVTNRRRENRRNGD